MSNPGDFVIEKGVLKKYTGPGGNVIIPNGVKRIGNNIFREEDILGRALRSGTACITNVWIPEGVIEIGDNAFSSCRSLTSVAIPESVIRIGDRVFAGCSNLTSLTIPKSLESIGNGVFDSCAGLADKNGFVIFNGALYLYLGSSGDIDIPRGVTTIHDNAFRENCHIKSVIIPDSIKYIGWRAFYNCRSLISVTFLGHVERISHEAFECCVNLRDVGMKEPLDRKMLANACLYAALNEQEMMELISTTTPQKSKIHWNKMSLGRFFGTYMTSNTRSAMLLAEKRMELDKYAAMRGMTADELRDKYLSDVGLDERGGKSYDLGNQIVTARLQKDLSVLFELPDGKTAKSLPKKGSDAEKYEAAKADFDEMRKAVKKIFKSRAEKLLQDFLSGSERSAADWTAVYLKNPLLRAVAELLVWEQGGRRFILRGSEAVDVEGQTYAITDDPIRVAHPMEMEAGDVTAWQKYLARHSLKQPFAQMWEPVIDEKTITSDRYKGCFIPYYRFLGQEKHGIKTADLSYHDYIVITFADCRADITRIDGARHTIQSTDRFEVTAFRYESFSRQVNHIAAYLDRVTVWDRIRSDDAAVMDLIDRFTLATSSPC